MSMLCRLAGFAGWAAAAVSGSAWGASGGTPTVVELFTSQSCYSCPAAEAYLGELAARGDVIALEFHVDYWDDLVYGAAGRWKDVFSSPAHTQRQRVYNRTIRGTGQVYTPQMIVGGRAEAAGTRRPSVEAAIADQARDARPRLEVTIERADGGGLDLSIGGTLAAPAAVWLVRFRPAHVTQVKAGENKGKTLVNHNVVTGMERIGTWSGTALRTTLPGGSVSLEEGCAVIVQGADQGPIHGAAECPRSPSRNVGR